MSQLPGGGRRPGGRGGAGGPEGPDGPGSLRPTPSWVPACWAVVGLAGGWLLHPLSDRLGSPPVVLWSQPLVLLAAAFVVGVVAWQTWRTVHVHRERLLPHQGLNRLVLARACAFIGAFVAGGYLGYALSWIGDPAELAEQRLGRSLAAAAAGLLLVLAALLLERSCRVRDDDDQP